MTDPQTTSAKIDQLKWLEGTWISQEDETIIQLTYAPAVNETRLGVYAIFEKGEVNFGGYIKIVSTESGFFLQTFVLNQSSSPLNSFTSPEEFVGEATSDRSIRFDSVEDQDATTIEISRVGDTLTSIYATVDPTLIAPRIAVFQRK
jgi:hypothetical protein